MPRANGAPVTIALLGGHELPTAYSLANDRWWRGLEAAGYRVLQTLSGEGKPRPPACAIHHDLSQKFSELAPLPGTPLAAVAAPQFNLRPRT